MERDDFYETAMESIALMGRLDDDEEYNSNLRIAANALRVGKRADSEKLDPAEPSADGVDSSAV